MLPYYIIVLYVFFIVILFKPKLQDHSKGKFIMLMLPLILFAVMRGNGKGDYFAYIDRGDKIKSLTDILDDQKTGMEAGYGLLAYIVYLLRLPRQFIVVFMNIISMGNISRFIKKNSVNWGISVLLFLPLYFQFDMHAARTAVSISICVAGYDFIKERCFLKYLICIAAASAFHSIALISLIAYFLYGIKIKMKLGITVLFTELVLIRFININSLLGKLLNVLGFEHLGNKLINYTVYKVEVYGYPMPLYDPRIWIGIFVFFSACNYIHRKNADQIFMTNGVFAYAFVIIFFSNTTFFAYRLSAYFYIFLVIIIPDIIVNFKNNAEGVYLCKRIRLYLLCALFFTVFNLAYANTTMADYITVFRSKSGLLPYS